MRMPRPLLWGVVLGVALLGGCASERTAVPPEPTASATPAPPSPNPNEVFRLDFDAADPLEVALGGFTVRGIGVGGGELKVVPSHGQGSAVEFPAYADAEDAAGLVLIVSAAGDRLPDPGERTFSFGADVRLSGEAASAQDNGDNVLQRGLASDPTQYKLQVDRGVPSCVVAGAAGRVLVKGQKLVVGSWYSLVCERDGAQVTLTATLLEDGSEPFVATQGGETGAVSFEADRPVSIGRKVTVEGEPVLKQPDQFNGALDSVWIAVG